MRSRLVSHSRFYFIYWYKARLLHLFFGPVFSSARFSVSISVFISIRKLMDV